MKYDPLTKSWIIPGGGGDGSPPPTPPTSVDEGSYGGYGDYGDYESPAQSQSSTVTTTTALTPLQQQHKGSQSQSPIDTWLRRAALSVLILLGLASIGQIILVDVFVYNLVNDFQAFVNDLARFLNS